jgi:hypothetical protein
MGRWLIGAVRAQVAAGRKRRRARPRGVTDHATRPRDAEGRPTEAPFDPRPIGLVGTPGLAGLTTREHRSVQTNVFARVVLDTVVLCGARYQKREHTITSASARGESALLRVAARLAASSASAPSTRAWHLLVAGIGAEGPRTVVRPRLWRGRLGVAAPAPRPTDIGCRMPLRRQPRVGTQLMLCAPMSTRPDRRR